MPCACRRADRDPQRDEALKVLEPPFKVLDAALAKQPYLLGDEFTVADLNVAAVISRAIDMDLARDAASKAWLMRCLERPAARAALALRAEADAADAGRGDAADRPDQSLVSDAKPGSDPRRPAQSVRRRWRCTSKAGSTRPRNSIAAC